MNKKIIILTSLGIGIVIGIIGSFIILGNTAKNTMRIFGLQNRAEWERRAYQAYKNENPTVGIWALVNLADILQEHEKIFANDKKNIQTDLALTFGRLAILHRIQKDDEEYKEYISKALIWAQKTNLDKIKNEAELLNILKQVDK